MALLLRDLALEINVDVASLPSVVAEYLKIDAGELSDFSIIRRSIDARRKNAVRRVYTVRFSVADEAFLLDNFPGRGLELVPDSPEVLIPRIPGKHHVLIVGMGPAGLFAAKWLVKAGARVTLIDRGQPIEQRIRDVEAFWNYAKFAANSNVQYGEGGAGTFSDGKLTTRLNHPLRKAVLETLVDFGAPADILVEARPHVGTDRLRGVIVNFRKYLINAGVDILFDSCLSDLEISHGRVCGGVINSDKLILCDALILAPGHSARDTYRMLAKHQVKLDAKGFAVGVRVEHPAALISQIQYGKFAGQLTAADYSLRYNDKQTGRGTYSFCMCPGGEIINAASESKGLVVNGMSRLARNSNYSNSALVVTVSPEDWGASELGGIHFQEKWEKLAFKVGGSNYNAPAQNLMAFANRGTGAVVSSCRPGVVEADLREVLPDFVYHGLQSALPQFDRQMKGFMTAEAVLVGVETRTSAPLRILRDDNGESLSHAGLYPAGEGAGYAGGIMSAAFDGIKAAEKIIYSVSKRESI